MFSRRALLNAVISFDPAARRLPAGTIADANIFQQCGRAAMTVEVPPIGDDAPVSIQRTRATVSLGSEKPPDVLWDHGGRYVKLVGVGE